MIITTKILGEMERNDHKLGLVSLCIGGGHGIATLLERDAAVTDAGASGWVSSSTTRVRLVQDRLHVRMYRSGTACARSKHPRVLRR